MSFLRFNKTGSVSAWLADYKCIMGESNILLPNFNTLDIGSRRESPHLIRQ